MRAGELIGAAIAAVCAFTSAPGVSATDPAIEWQEPCAFEAAKDVAPDRVKCGVLTVPLDWSGNGTAAARLPVAVIRALSDTPQPDPVVFLSGGPGGAPTTSAHSFNLFAAHAFGKDRDIVLFTQRGAQSTEPELRCDPLRGIRLSIVADDMTMAERDAKISSAARACLASLAAKGIPLHAFSAKQNAHDMRALRQALGVRQWNLLGVSYGTYMALEAVRLDPEGVRTLILDSVVSPESDLFMSEASGNFERGISRIVEACAASEPCSGHFPDLTASLDAVVAALAKAPPTVMLTGKDGKADVRVVVNDHDFLSLIHWMLYSPQALPLVPMLIDATASGDLGPLTTLMNSVYPAPAAVGDSAAGAFFAIVCADQYRPSRGRDLGKGRFGLFAITSFMQDVCADPARGYGRMQSAEPVRVQTPTLILSGRFDPMTPDVYAEEIAGTLPNSQLVRFGNWGHSVLSGYRECQTDLAAAFLSKPEIHLLSSSCDAEKLSPEFRVQLSD
ncbi:alpha/beta fold hydrolase [Pseudokordiimonas caeni]|uniref:alpha/beta fold hydrolase n=1 Tax=Pseudokordiimonas caeni TaxID=2997908 RepID=UPI002810E87E|nr:alpha/beta fold hydrolase [Pseudokordiimonas caeni]